MVSMMVYTLAQKEVLRQYVNSVDSTPVLREFYNTEVGKIKTQLTELYLKLLIKLFKLKLMK
jgi:hypothetical protein